MSLRDLKAEEAISFQWPGVDLQHPTETTRSLSSHRSQISRCGIAANSSVETMRGAVVARDLRKGDLVRTRSRDFAVLQWIGYSRVAPNDQHRPIRFHADGSLVARDAHVLIESPRNELYFGTHSVLAPAKFMTEVEMASEDDSVNPLIVHLLFDRVVQFRCGEFWIESLLPDMKRIREADEAAAEDVVQVLPRLASESGVASYQRDLLVLNRREVHMLLS